MNQIPRIDLRHIEKFDGTEFQQYKHGISMELEIHNLNDLVEVTNVDYNSRHEIMLLTQ